MKEILNGKWMAWGAFALVIVLLVATFQLRQAWWAFIDIFFAFMAAFINLVAVMTAKINPVVSRKLNAFVMAFLVLFIVSFIGEWIAYYALFN